MEFTRYAVSVPLPPGPLPKAALDRTGATLAPHIAPLLPRPFVIDALILCGEDADGRFHELRRAPLGG